MSQSRIWVQADFSLGQVTKTAARRLDNPLMKRACRTATNFQPMVTGAAERRSGRKALFEAASRVDEVTMPPATKFKLEFAATTLKIRNNANAVVATFTGLPWNAAGVPIVRWALFTTQIIVTYPGMIPQVVSYKAATGAWSIADFAFLVGEDGKSRQPYYRFPETIGISMTPSARDGTINVAFSANVLTAEHVGTSFRYANEELTIATVVDGQNGTATVVQKLPPSGQVSLIIGRGDLTPVTEGFYVGDVIEGDVSGCRAQVTDVSGNTIKFVILKNFGGFKKIENDPYTTENIVSPRSKAQYTGASYSLAPEPSTYWDEAFMSPARGWPASCSVDARRLIFCQFAGETTGILWGEISSPNAFNIGANPTDAMLELVPGQAGVIDVVGGNDQFVLCNSAVFFIPISADNPLKPGSVEFRRVGPEGAANVAPTQTSEGVIYINAAKTRVMAIIGTGQVARPYVSRDLTLYHADLINAPVCMAVTSGDGIVPERYAFIVNGDGSMVIGRYDVSEDVIGWFPWTGAGMVKWASAKAAYPLFTVTYGATTLAEVESAVALLDGEVPATGPPTELAPGGGQGPFWMYAGQTLTLRRGGKPVGERAINGSGNVVWTDADEDRTTDTLIGGFAFDSELEPFVPNMGEGENLDQHMRKRKINKAAITVQNSTGFTYARKTAPMYDVGDDKTANPPPRDDTYLFASAGLSWDPRESITKTTIGSLRVLEIAMEVTT